MAQRRGRAIVRAMGRSRDVRVSRSRRSLSWRVFLVNAAVLVGVSTFYVFSPATISSPVATWEGLVLVAAITVTLFVNLVLLERAFAPLDELRRLMQSVDPLEPGRRIELRHADADVATLADAFNAMLDRLETERQRVARDLHDELGQLLTGVLLLIGEATKAPPERSAEALEEAREAARTAIDAVRRIVRDLRPEALDDLGLPSAMASLATAFERQTGIALERRIPSQLAELSPEQQLVVYRVAQEALTNIARHADARHAQLLVERPDGHVRVRVVDDGRGIDAPPPEHGGIRGMRERALLVRGRVDVRSQPGGGTHVVLSIPLEER
jgi:two-component system, NarL family, sensor histidine kinase UhpB